jgi:hypothetical protein
VEIFTSQGAPPVSTTPVANLPQVSIHQWQIAAGINDTGGKFVTGINDTGGKFCPQFPLCCSHSKTCLYLMDGRGVLWFDKSSQLTGFLIRVLVIFSPAAPTTKILKNKNKIKCLVNMFGSHCTVQ